MVQASSQAIYNADRTVNVDILKTVCEQRFTGVQFSQVEKALSLACEHDNDTALEMAAVLFELNTDPTAIIAALLYPVFESQKINSLEVKEQFGDSVWRIIRGVRDMSAAKILLTHRNDLSQVDRLRKMLLAMINDVRVVLVKLAERLVLLRHAKNFDDDARHEIAASVMQIYAPLANRLGIGQMKWEMEDRAFMILNTAEYKEITQQLSERRLDRENYVEGLIEQLTDNLKEQGIPSEVTGRVKHIYSIHRKMVKKQLGFEGLFDIQAMRILVRDVNACYRALSLVHELFTPIQSEFDDYISTPKANGYRSIHTVVEGPQGKNIEIQIRSFAMHEESEMGVAAHWRYKEGTSRDASYETRITWLRDLLSWQRELAEDDEHIEAMRAKVVDDRVYVFTPQGQVMDMQLGSTPIDFAYHVHSEVGHRCRGAKVNGSIVPLTYQLKTGDQIEIMTTKESRPSRDWLSERLGYVRCPKVRTKIAQWFRQQNKAENATIGKERLLKECAKLHITKIDYDDLLKRANQVHLDDFFSAIATGDIKLQGVLSRIQGLDNADNTRELSDFQGRKRTGASGDFIIEGVDNALISPAGCCRPVAGDDIIGYISQGAGIKVHREDCHQASILKTENPERFIDVSWSKEIKGKYPVDLSLFGTNRDGLLRDITATVSNEELAISGLNTQTDRRGNTVTITLTVDIDSKERVERLQDVLLNLPGISEVARR